MRYLYYFFFALFFVSCASRIEKNSALRNEKKYAITYSILRDSLSFESGGKHLAIIYNGKEKYECDILFRVFFAWDSNTIDYTVNSDNYIGSYSVSPSCEDKFLIPITSKVSGRNSYSVLRFSIVPLDINGMELKKNITNNFSFSIE